KSTRIATHSMTKGCGNCGNLILALPGVPSDLRAICSTGIDLPSRSSWRQVPTTFSNTQPSLGADQIVAPSWYSLEDWAAAGAGADWESCSHNTVAAPNDNSPATPTTSHF